MPFRTIEPEVADQLSVLQARRDAVRQRIQAGGRMRAEVDQLRRAEQLAIAETEPARLAKEVEKRCSDRLASATAQRRWLVIVWKTISVLTAVIGGPFLALILLVGLVIANGSWIHAVGGSLVVVGSFLLLVRAKRQARRRLAGFRSWLRSHPFSIAGAEETLGREGELIEMTFTITLVDDVPLDTVGNLVALVAPGVQVGQRSKTSVTRGSRGIVIGHRFDTFEQHDGTQHEKDGTAPVVWVHAMVASVLVPLHELHAISSVEVSE